MRSSWVPNARWHGREGRAHTGAIDIPILTDATHTLLDAFRKIPGSDWIESAVDSGADWIGNAAKTPEGLVVLQAITSGLATQLSQVAIPSVDGMRTVGPQLASVVFALPGVTAGKDFTDAYVSELIARIIGTAAVLAANPELASSAANSFSPVISQSIQQIASNAATASANGATVAAGQAAAYRLAMTTAISTGITTPLKSTLNNVSFKTPLDDVIRKIGLGANKAVARAALRDAGLTPPDLAKKLGVRPDVAALGLNQYLQSHVYDVGAPPFYNPHGGSAPGGTAEFDVDGQPNSNYAIAETPVGAPLPNVALAEAQKALASLGLLRIYALGVGGVSTTAAIASFQSAHGLPATGVPDSATSRALQDALRGQRPVLVTTPAENAEYTAARQHIQAILAKASPRRPLLVTLLQVSLITSPIWFTLLILPKMMEKKSAAGRRRS